jgi:hypothetical protein
MKVVFLDIDGVIATDETDFVFFDKSCLKRLKHIIETADASIVLSSTWRRGRSVDNIRGLFARGGDEYGCWVFNPDPFPVERIVGKTPNFRENSEEQIRREAGMSWGRGYEIDTWLKWANKYNKVESYLVLDDDSADLQTHADRQVKTDSRKGLRDEDISPSLEILARPV